MTRFQSVGSGTGAPEWPHLLKVIPDTVLDRSVLEEAVGLDDLLARHLRQTLNCGPVTAVARQEDEEEEV